MEAKNLLLSGALIAGLGLTGYSQFFSDGNTLNELIRNGLLSLAGAGGLFYNNFSYLKSFVVSNDAGKVFKPKDFENEDFRCLIHLRNRVAAVNDSEGLETCAKLNDILFSLHQRNKVQSNEEPADASKKV